MDNNLLTKSLFTILKPHIHDYEGERGVDIFDDSSQMNLHDLKFLCSFLARDIVQDEETFSIQNLLTLLKTFWYVCDSVLSWNLLSSQTCRDTILLSIDTCNARSIGLPPDSQHYEALTQLSGLFGYIFQRVVSKRSTNNLNVTDDELVHFDISMKNLAHDFFIPRGDLKKDVSTLQNHMKWWTWDILDKVVVFCHPNPKILSLLLEQGANAKITTLDHDVVQTSIDILYERFCDQVDSPSLYAIAYQERQDVEECIKLLYKVGGRSTLPIDVILEDVQILGIGNDGDSDMDSQNFDSGNEEEEEEMI